MKVYDVINTQQVSPRKHEGVSYKEQQSILCPFTHFSAAGGEGGGGMTDRQDDCQAQTTTLAMCAYTNGYF